MLMEFEYKYANTHISVRKSILPEVNGRDRKRENINNDNQHSKDHTELKILQMSPSPSHLFQKCVGIWEIGTLCVRLIQKGLRLIKQFCDC